MVWMAVSVLLTLMGKDILFLSLGGKEYVKA